MRFYLSVDMEGIAGVAAPGTAIPGRADYEKARVWMTREANAAIEGAFAAGATEVVVNDSHGPMINLLPDQLDRRALLLTGTPKRYMMMEGVDQGFDGAAFIGYHGRAGIAQSVMAHTISDYALEIRLNGEPCSETRLNALLAGAFGVPVLLVAGDRATCEDAAKVVPGCATVQVKEGVGVGAALSLHPDEACDRIRQGVEAAITSPAPAVTALDPPYSLEVELLTLQLAELAALVPGTSRLDGRTVGFRTDNFLEAFGALLSWLYLAPAAVRLADC